MARAKTKVPDLGALVAKAAKSAPTDSLASAVGALVKARLRKAERRKADRSFAGQAGGDRFGTPAAMDPSGFGSKPQRRAKPYRSGRVRAYTPTNKWNDARRGTFRHYMLATIMAHSDTASAERAHRDSGAHVGKKLDFTWAANNGFINWA